MRKDIVLDDGRTVAVWDLTGEVIEARDWTETEIYSQASPGFVSNGVIYGGGYRTSSTTTNKLKLWIRLADGREQPLGFDFSLDVRVGHKISVIYFQINNLRSDLAFIDLLTTQKTWNYMIPSYISSVARRTGVTPAPIYRWLLVAASLFIFFPLLPIALLNVFRLHLKEKKIIRAFIEKMTPVVEEVRSGAQQPEPTRAQWQPSRTPQNGIII